MPFSQFKVSKTYCEERSCITADNFLNINNKGTSLCCMCLKLTIKRPKHCQLILSIFEFLREAAVE